MWLELFIMPPIVLQSHVVPVQVIEGYRRVRWRRWLHFVLMVLTLGLWWFMVRWWPTLGLRLHSKHCGLHKADTVLMQVTFPSDRAAHRLFDFAFVMFH